MTDNTRALLEQALGALVRAEMMYGQPNQAVQAALRAELAKPEQEESFIPNWANYRQGVADGKADSPKWHDAPEVAALKAERDELLAALKRARPHIGVGYSAIQRHTITSLVDAAIAKAEGGAG